MEVRHIRAFEHQAEMKYKLYNKLSDEEYWEYLKYAYYGLWFNCNFRELAKSLYEHKIKDFIKQNLVGLEYQIKRFDREDTLSKFMEIDKSIRCNEKAQAFLELGGSGCWVGSLDEIRGDRIDYGISR